MPSPARNITALLWPSDDMLSTNAKSRLQVVRLLCLLGSLLIPLYGLLYEAARPEATDPMWIRLVIAGVLGAFVAGTYVLRTLRTHCVGVAWGLLYLLMAWSVALAAVNQFSGAYVVGMLVVYAVSATLVLVSSQLLRSVLSFLSAGLLLMGAALLWAPAVQLSPLVLCGGMAMVAFVVGVVARWVLRVRRHLADQARELEEQRDRLEGHRAYTNRLLNATDDLFFALDPTGQFQWWNDRVLETTGLSDEDVGSVDALDHFVPAEREKQAKQAIRRVLQTGSGQVEVPLVADDGVAVPYEFVGNPVENLEGERQIVCVGRNVAERKRRERELRESERRFQAMLNDPNILAGVLSPDGTFQKVNDTALGYIEATRADVLGRPFWETPWWETENRSAVRKKVERVAEGEYMRFEAEHVTPDGEARTVTGIMRPVTGEEGEVVSIFVTARDITERKRREEALQVAEGRYRALIENFPGGVFLFDEDLQYTLAGGRELRDAGLSPSDVEGGGPHDIFPAALAEELDMYFRRALNGEKNAFEQTMDGRRYFNRTLPVRDEAGTVIAGMAVAQDITEERRRKEKLERKNDLFQRAQEIANVGGWEYDLDTGALTLTDQACRIHGVSPGAKMTLERSHGLYHPNDRWEAEEAFRRAAEDGVPYDVEARLITDAGEEKWIRTRGAPQQDDGRTVRVRGTIQDITDQKEREQALRTAKADAEAARQEAEEASRLKSAFLANISHEIRTPLTSIIGFAELIGSEAGALDLSDSPLPGYATMIERSGKRLLETLEGVLNLSKLQSGQMKLETAPVDLNEQIRWAVQELRPKAEEKGVRLQLETGCAVAEGDEGGIQIVIRNLVSNAIKYTEQGGHIWVRSFQNEDRAVLEVEDTGIGMDPAVAESLFEPFRQASEGLNREYEGTGVGLAVTNKAVAQMDGSIEVDTEKGEGTRFTIQLPASEEHPTDGSAS
ncbi:PAS domain-containing sensor histidine kinase [Salinibacter ruber]|uniref:PAS domain-containing sensor histidine kinase n=1 Tax=Salinibacter ruber TaxID=146919 RepID=UPI002073A975|nr:PAS domain-containing sensor histidine kinase [Salinibacter ruber]